MTDRRRNGFTLLELLVVIAIVVVLAGLLFPAVQSVLERAKKVQAKNDLTQIVTAVNAYYTEYGKYPFTPASGEHLTSNEPADLFYTLRAIASGTANQNNAVNPRLIVFMTPPNVKDTSNPRSGISGIDGQFYDPWGSPYQIAVDATYDTNIDNPYLPDTGAGPSEIRQNALAWSFGRDKQIGNAGDQKFTGSDDVISWQ